MKRNLILIAAAALILPACNNVEKDFDSIKKEVKAQFAPDSRDKTFEVELEKSGKEYILRGATTEEEAKEAIVAQLKEKNISVLDSIKLLPDAELGEKTYGVTALSVINFRMKPGYSEESGTQTLMGMPLRILENRGGWLRAITPEGYIAWVTEKSVAKMTKEEFDSWKSAPKWMVNTHYTLLREKPDINSEIVCDAVWGCTMAKGSGIGGDWHEVILPTGKRAYVLKREVVDFESWAENVVATPESVIASAKKMLGFPYMWGATSVKAVDCSGFSKTTYLMNGIILKRDASQQCYTGDEVDISEGIGNLQMGDLIFFGRKATETQKERVTHVGIYIGDGEFIHSASYVRINSLIEGTDNYYEGSPRLVRAIRVIGSQDSGKGIVSIKKHPWYLNN